MKRLNLEFLLCALALAAGCSLLVDPDNGEISAGGALQDRLCEQMSCGVGTHCELREVQCSKAPCAPQPECVPGDDGTGPGDGDSSGNGSGPACGKSRCEQGMVCCNASCGICTEPDGVCIQLACDEGEPPTTCAATTCEAGSECIEGPNGAECRPIEGPGSCALALCAPNTYCDDTSGKVKCLPLPSCDDEECDDGEHCELKQVQCVKAPCPPQPTCVKDDPCALVDCAGECEVRKGKAYCLPVGCQKDPCATVKCSAGYHCEASDAYCPFALVAQCCPVGICVANDDDGGKSCGDNTCGAGTYCCNASCGVCASIGAGCTQEICDQED